MWFVLLTLQCISAVICSGFLFFLFLRKDQQPQFNDFWQSLPESLLFAGLSLVGGLYTMAARMLDDVVDFEWIPLLYVREERRPMYDRVHISITAARVIAPLLTGFLLSVWVPRHIGLIVLISLFLTSLILLFSFLYPFASAGMGYSLRSQTFWKTRFPNAFALIWSEWPVYSNQTVFFVLISNLFLWISILNPNSPILTAILKVYDYDLNFLTLFSNPVLGLLRSVSALFGLGLSQMGFRAIMDRFGLISTTQIFIIFSTLMSLFAAISFQVAAFDIPVVAIVFFSVVILFRFGSCGFAFGEIQIIQAGVARRWLNTFELVHIACTDIALFLLYMVVSILSLPRFFHLLVWLSFTSTALASILFLFWSLNPVNRNVVLLGPVDFSSLDSASDPNILSFSVND